MSLWPWRRPAAAAPIPPLAWELPCATGVAITRKKIYKSLITNLFYFFVFFWPCLWHAESLGQESKHISHPSHSSDNADPHLLCGATRELPVFLFFVYLCVRCFSSRPLEHTFFEGRHLFFLFTVPPPVLGRVAGME